MKVSDEVHDATTTINSIVDILDKLQAGQEIIFDKIEEMQRDFTELLSSIPLGKKPFVQRLLGIIAMYAGEKGADAAIEQITPLVRDILNGSSLQQLGG